jgi:hypothetical protein
MLLRDRRNRPWIAVISTATVVAIAWYAWASLAAGRLLGGGSRTGLVFGIAGGLICLFEMLLWPRKALRRWGQMFPIGWTQAWMRAHVWLGLFSLPLLLMHGRVVFWGSALSSVLMGLFLVVIASGIWGLAMQQVIPRKLLEEVSAETIHSQIPYVRAQLRGEATRLVLAACGAASEDAGLIPPEFHVAGKVRDRSTCAMPVLASAVTDARPLVEAFRTTIAPYLCPDPLYSYFRQNEHDRTARPPVIKEACRSVLDRTDQAGALFASLRGRLDARAHTLLDTLEDLCSRRRQFERQAHLHRLLHNWMAIHLPLSVGMTVLMVVHAVAALGYL